MKYSEAVLVVVVLILLIEEHRVHLSAATPSHLLHKI